MSLEEAALNLSATCAANNRWDREVLEFPNIGFIRVNITQCTLQTINSSSSVAARHRMSEGLNKHCCIFSRLLYFYTAQRPSIKCIPPTHPYRSILFGAAMMESLFSPNLVQLVHSSEE